MIFQIFFIKRQWAKLPRSFGSFRGNFAQFTQSWYIYQFPVLKNVFHPYIYYQNIEDRFKSHFNTALQVFDSFVIKKSCVKMVKVVEQMWPPKPHQTGGGTLPTGWNH